MFKLNKINSIVLLKRFLPFIILAIWAFIIHFAFLSQPSQVVFDEFYFGSFVTYYFSHSFYFDIHPPLGKLLIAGFAKLLDFNFNFHFFWVGRAGMPIIFFILRFLPALFGSLFVCLFSWLAYLVSRSRTVALIAGFLVLLDNAFLVQTRFILVDIFLLFFEVLTLCFLFLYQRQKSFSLKWFVFVILTGVSFGLTISIKWTGLAIFGIIGIILLVKIFSSKLAGYLTPGVQVSDGLAGKSSKWSLIKKFKWSFLKTKLKEPAVAFAIILILGLAVYLVSFVIHFKILTDYGSREGYVRVISDQMGEYYTTAKGFKEAGFWEKFFRLNKSMLKASASAITAHPSKSSWYNWPLDIRPMSFWSETHLELIEPGETAKIFLIGNPVIWLLALFSVLFTLILSLFKKWRQKLKPIHYILLLGYFANLLPFIFIKRDAFLYHYLPSLTYAILLASLWLVRISQKHKIVLIIMLLLATLSFFSLLPVSYGWVIPADSLINKYEIGVFNFFGGNIL